MVLEHTTRRWMIPIIIVFIILLVDQMSKQWVLHNLGPEPGATYVAIAGEWFHLVYSQNTGIAFNFFPNMSPFFIITSLLIAGLIVYGYVVHLPNHNIFVQGSIGLILGGALGNTLDRILHGFVVDFIQIGWWPIFNIADSAITSGAVILTLFLVLTKTIEQIPLSPQDDALLNELLVRNVEENQTKTTAKQSSMLGADD